MGIRSDVVLAIISKHIENAPEFVKEKLNSADDIKQFKKETVGEYHLYCWDYEKWDIYDETMILFNNWLESLPRWFEIDDLSLFDNKPYQLIVYTAEIEEIICLGSIDFGLSVGIQHNP